MATALYDFLLQFAKTEKMKKNTVLYHIGDEKRPDVILLRNGAVKASWFTASGEEQVYHVFREGEIMMLVNAFDETLPKLNYTVLWESEIGRINAWKAKEIMTGSMSAQNLVILELIEMIHYERRLLREMLNDSSERRICDLLLAYADRDGIPYNGRVLISERVSQQFIASSLRISRSTVARTIRELKKSRLIEYINGYLCITDLPAFTKKTETL